MEREESINRGERAEGESIVGQYAKLFVQRFDTYARQRDHSRAYYRVLDPAGRPRPLTPAILTAHLKGEITIGLYSIDQQGLTKWSVIDSDEGLWPLFEAKGKLAEQGIESYLERSRAGGHLWVFWDRTLRPDTARRILSPYAGDLELFPSGDVPDEDGLGLVMRAPLGIHRLSMHRYGFLDDNARPVSQGKVRGQLAWLLANLKKVDPSPFDDVLPGKERRSVLERAGIVYRRGEAGPIASWVASVDVAEVIGQYLELNRCGIGHCPWPEKHRNGDRHKSFAVFPGTQKWWCFTERIGGNAFDFLCRYFQVGAVEMLRTLRA